MTGSRALRMARRAPLLAMFAAAGLAACRAHNDYTHGSSGDERASTDNSALANGDVYNGAASLTSMGVDPGIHPQVVLGDRTNPYTGNQAAAVEGRRLFVAMNCSGCHGGRAGGGMGPSLRDSLWANGGSDVQVFSTITEGRPAGMPAWGAKLTEDQIWKLIAYIRTLGTPDEPDPPPPAANPLKVAPPPGRG